MIYIILGLVVLWFIIDILERQRLKNYYSFPSRSDYMRSSNGRKYVCPICGFDYPAGGLCPNPDHELAEMVEQNLEHKTQDPAPTEIIRKILNEPGKIDL